MYKAVFEVMKFRKIDAAVMTAAPCDFQPEKRHPGKIKKGTQESLSLNLTRTKDILMDMGKMENPPILCGFALESENIIEYAKKKLVEKKLDFIVANTPKSFAGDSLEDATILFKDGREEPLGSVKKEEIAERILAEIENIWNSSKM
jgi:phosphopantothenoylcysteine decarboxylase/phosphopantothenate--cysteine ligase